MYQSIPSYFPQHFVRFSQHFTITHLYILEEKDNVD